MACRVLNVSRSGYYDWLGRPDSLRVQENELLLKQIRDIHKESRFTYGSPRVHAELTLGLGLPVNLKRVARVMREAGIQGLYRRRRRGCSRRGIDYTLVRTGDHLDAVLARYLNFRVATIKGGGRAPAQG